MAAEVKFCGLTRDLDALEAARLGAAYVGAIFAGGPRLVDVERAAANFASLPSQVRRVGVFGRQTVDEIRTAVDAAALDVVQLHGDPTESEVRAVREAVDVAVWPVCRVEGASLPAEAERLAGAAGVLVLDAKVSGALGGTGRALPWPALATALAGLRERVPCRIVLAGGLDPDNVGRAIHLLHPDVVDVSSGVEHAPGLKDHGRMRAFMSAVQRAGVRG